MIIGSPRSRWAMKRLDRDDAEASLSRQQVENHDTSRDEPTNRRASREEKEFSQPMINLFFFVELIVKTRKCLARKKEKRGEKVDDDGDDDEGRERAICSLEQKKMMAKEKKTDKQSDLLPVSSLSWHFFSFSPSLSRSLARSAFSPRYYSLARFLSRSLSLSRSFSLLSCRCVLSRCFQL